MLQNALEYRCVEVVSLLLERPGVDVASVNLCSLYLNEDPYNFFRSEASLELTGRRRRLPARRARPRGRPRARCGSK